MDLPDKPEGKLRTGFTTGTCATAASKASLLAIINQQSLDNVDVLLPKREKINIQINSCSFSKDNAQCSVIKDGGDDPDVCLLYTSPSPRDLSTSRMPSSA